MIAVAPCPLFRCVAVGDWGCAAGGQDAVVRLWSLEAGELLQEFHGHGDLATAVAWNGSGLLASGSTDRTARLWSLDTGVVTQTLVGHGGPVDGVTFSGDSVVTASADRTVRWWSATDGEATHSHPLEHPLVSCTADRSGRIVATGGTGGDVTVFIDEIVERSIPGAHQGPIFAVELSADGTELLTTGADGLARLWSTESGTVLHTFRGHRGPVLAGALGHGVIVTGSSDGTVRIWDPVTGGQTQQIAGLVGGVPGVDLNENGTLIVTSAGGHVRTMTVIRPVAPN